MTQRQGRTARRIIIHIQRKSRGSGQRMANLKQSIGQSGKDVGLESDSGSLCVAEVGRGCREDVSAFALGVRVGRTHSRVHCRLPSGEK